MLVYLNDAENYNNNNIVALRVESWKKMIKFLILIKGILTFVVTL